jgi:hypothetical protein
MSERTDRFIRAQEEERKAREMLQEIVDQFLRVAEGLYDWQDVDFQWRQNHFELVLHHSDCADNDTTRKIDLPTMADVRDAVVEAQNAADNLRAVTAELTQEEQEIVCPSGIAPVSPSFLDSSPARLAAVTN